MAKMFGKFGGPKIKEYRGYCILDYGDEYEVVRPDNTKFVVVLKNSKLQMPKRFRTRPDAMAAISEDIEKEKNK